MRVALLDPVVDQFEQPQLHPQSVVEVAAAEPCAEHTVFAGRRFKPGGVRGATSQPYQKANNISDDVQQAVFSIIAREAGIDEVKITPDSTLKDLEIPSLDAIQIIFEIEDRYKIQMPDRDPDFDTESVKGLVDTVEKLLEAKKANPPTPPSAPASG